MTDKNTKNIKEWKNKADKSSKRNYSFDTVSGENVDLAYFPENGNIDADNSSGNIP